MIKKDFISQSKLNNQGSAFAISFSTEKSKNRISYSLKIWTLILLLATTIASNGQEIVSVGLQKTSVESDIITINIIGDTKIDYDKLRELKGNVSNREAQNFSFCLINAQGKKVYSSDIEAIDEKFDEPNEDFIIRMPDKLPEAQYKLIIYTDSKNNQRKENEKHHMIISL